jgi:hypothetical protein
MAQSTSARSGKATTDSSTQRLVDGVWERVRPQLVAVITSLQTDVTPASFMRFEQVLRTLLLECGRLLVEAVINGLETPSQTPQEVKYQGLGYRRLRKKTCNRFVATLFGTVCLCRFAYRYWDVKHVTEPCVFPLELRLGLIEGVTPALGSRIGEHAAASPQRQTLDWLRQDHGVAMGAERFRKFIGSMSLLMSEHQHASQVQALLEALEEANNSRGGRRPVLAVGRDGVTLCDHLYSFWEVATAATITVFDRSGKRKLTVYLAHSPELGQASMSRMLTDLLRDVLQQWEGPLPTLAYIADSGGNESGYFEEVLSRMDHPRTGARLAWQRVVDYYHVAERVWTIAEALFGKKGRRYQSWALRMLKILKHKQNAPKRLLHSAAAHAKNLILSEARQESLRKALNYIRRRTQWMQYAEYRKRHIPIGSGITEAACKTIFAQRLKLSGMRWSRAGADRVLTLRTILLSGVWNRIYNKVLLQFQRELPVTYAANVAISARTAA